MSFATRDLIGEVGDVASRCELVLEMLKRIERLVDGTESLTFEDNDALGDVTKHLGGESKDYLDRAFTHVNLWYVRAQEVLKSLDKHGSSGTSSDQGHRQRFYG